MHDQRTPAPRPGALALDPSLDELQRRLLLELVTDPPPDGDTPTALAHRLDAPPTALEQAVRALEHAGLAQRADDRVRATRAALRFDELRPIR